MPKYEELIDDIQVDYHNVLNRVKEILQEVEYEFRQREKELLEDFPNPINEEQEVTIKRIKRYQNIVDDSKVKYGNKCQIKDCGFTFRKKNGELYSEGHHLFPLSEGGTQEKDNIVILCPNHHRMMHYANIKIDDLKQNEREVKINGVNHIIVY